eukprot:429454-Rhodomonas_salina.1
MLTRAALEKRERCWRASISCRTAIIISDAPTSLQLSVSGTNARAWNDMTTSRDQDRDPSRPRPRERSSTPSVTH